MKLGYLAVASVFAIGFAGQASAVPQAFAAYSLYSGVAGTGVGAQTTNLEVGTRQARDGGSAYLQGYSTRTGTSVSVDRVAATATNGTPLSQVSEVLFQFQNLPDLQTTSGNNRSILTNMFYLDVHSLTDSPSTTLSSGGGLDITNIAGTIVFKPAEGVSGVFSNGRIYDQNSVLLSVTFNSAELIRKRTIKSIGDDTGAVSDPSYMASYVTFSSDYLDFTDLNNPVLQRQLAASFTSDVNLAGTNQIFRAASNGTYSSDPVPTITTGAVPEAGTWAMMVIGFGAVGGSVWGRRQRTTANA